MGRLYGGRWRSVGDLGHGGQSQVFRVVDESGALAGQYALKWVKNPKRQARFKAEIEAIQTLRHPSIISLIDHSALDPFVEEPERQYLVMPIASGGSLEDPGRVAGYANSIEVTIQVALQLASALDAAHAANIIHRDVKPANVLFTGNGHEVLLCDFGICLIRENDRHTESREVVGPRSFMAPELEAGGPSDVTPAADVYALGKLIYFMISGGVTLPREELSDPRYAYIFERGEHYRQLQLLLTRMICLLDRRIKSMAQVLDQLKAIDAWEKTAVSLAVDPEARRGISRLQGRALANAQKAAEVAASRASNDQLVASVVNAFSSWSQLELSKLAAHIRTADIAVSVSSMPQREGDDFRVQLEGHSWYEMIAASELILQIGDPFGVHALRLLLCRKFTIVVHGGGDAPIPELVVLSTYAKPSANIREAKKLRHAGFLTRRESVGETLGAVTLGPRKEPALRPWKLKRVAATFRAGYSLYTPFKVDDWIIASEKLRAQLQETIGVFVDFAMEDQGTVGE